MKQRFLALIPSIETSCKDLFRTIGYNRQMSETNHWFVYILSCCDNSLYTGITTNLERRIHEHNEGNKGAKYTRARRPVTLVYSEAALDRSAATRREMELKSLPADKKRNLIQQT